jgi:tight adherence protein C
MRAGAVAGLAAAASVLTAATGLRTILRPPGVAPAPTVTLPSPRDAPLPAKAARTRARRVHAEIPQLLDLLAAGSTAGLSAELSFRRASESLRGPLGEDLRRVASTADLGTPWRVALGEYTDQTGDPDLRRTVTVLARTEVLGVSLSDATRELASSVREARRAATLERARTAPVKMLFPLVFLILPAFLLLTVVPVLITTVRSIN